MDKYKRFSDMIKESDRIVFFGGAGVSTESGLKDYRSADGIYKTAKQYGVPPEEILSHDCFFNNTELFYRFYRDYFMEEVQPNATHYALAELEKKGKRVSIVTQNIDGLHQKAGSSEVYELHGTTAKYYCTKCGEEFGMDYLRRRKENVPKCNKCGAIIKPKVVLYGEMLDGDVVDGALKAIEKAELMIIGGTSLAVQPAASFVSYFRGNGIVIINKESTPYDSYATLVFNEGLGGVFGEIMKTL